MSSGTIIHVGLAKTGTTLLQRALFANHPQIECIGKPRIYEDDRCLQMVEKIKEQDEIEFGKNLEEFRRREVGPLLETDKVVVLSDETLSSTAGVGRVQKARRLREVFGPTTKVMIVIRNQVDILGSYYLQYIKQTNTKGYRPYDDWVKTAFEEKEFNSPLHIFNYADLVDAYCNIFGRDRVRVFLYEDLRKNADSFVEDVSRYLGVDPKISKSLTKGQSKNVRLSRLYMSLLRVKVAVLPRIPILRWFPAGIRDGVFDMLQKGRPEEVKLSEEWKKQVLDYYRAGNQKLMTEYGLDLSRRGYAV